MLHRVFRIGALTLAVLALATSSVMASVPKVVVAEGFGATW